MWDQGAHITDKCIDDPSPEKKWDPGKPPWSTGATVGQIVIGGGKRCVLDESKVSGSL